MGSEQSSQNSNQNANSGKTRTNQLRRGKSVPNLNRPIGDSPKMTNKQSQLYRGKSIGAGEISRRKNSLGTTNHNHRKINISDNRTHNIVVVKPAQADPTADKDPDIVKLQSIPMFLPIMRGTLNLPPGVRDPEVLERLDPVGLFNLCARYQHHLNTNAQITAAEQATLCTSMEVEFNKVLNLAVDRQKRFARFAEQMNKVHELSRQLTRCHSLLNQTLGSLETLNNLLPVEERLEPFVWTTG
ncbi:PREDICTED: loss of heterozygosity 12 chromosomal region 1 protein homolog isoform X2 [Wasmannia auropunctata]|uniref:loss of heterozygosity 12 chromosomal region 1 protein homolog isoform X2 n=1 Tax=Wasmannia auropunctata TaxID=64793 RepID=UPI0005EF7008|nr:PREDICTED: loss of heterozygosity 12 chromosomal region 1 protein homolog isoform X2 [Wasmannia auropunctata]